MTARGAHRRRGRWFVSRTALAAAGCIVAASGAAWGYFDATGHGYGVAKAGSVAEPASPSASATSATRVTLSWYPPDPTPPGAFTYAVTTGTLGNGKGTCAATMSSTTLTCTVTGLEPGKQYMWSLEVNYENWSSARVVTGTTTLTYPQMVLADHPVAFYPLADARPGTMTDSSGNSHNGTYGGPTGTTSDLTFGQPGPLGGGQTPDGAVEAGPSTSPTGTTVGEVPTATFLPSGNSTRTVEAWFEATTKTVPTARYALVTWGTAGAAEPYGLVVSQHAVIVDHYQGTEQFTTTATLFDGNWHFIVVTYDGSDPGYDAAYLDGKPLETPQRVGSTTLATASPSTLYIGDWVDHVLNHARVGEIADVAIYSAALTATQITAQYAAAGE